MKSYIEFFCHKFLLMRHNYLKYCLVVTFFNKILTSKVLKEVFSPNNGTNVYSIKVFLNRM